MATVTEVTKTREKIVTEEVTTGVLIELSLEEAEHLMFILGRQYGHPYVGHNSLFFQLDAAGIKHHNDWELRDRGGFEVQAFKVEK